MTDTDIMLIVSLGSIVATILLLARYYQAKIDEANEAANFWRLKAEQLEKPSV